MTSAALANLVRSAAIEVASARKLDTTALSVSMPATSILRRPRGRIQGNKTQENQQHIDYLCTLALNSAKVLGVSTNEFASWLADALQRQPSIATAKVSGPGFVELTLNAEERCSLVGAVLVAGADYGRLADDLTWIENTLAAKHLMVNNTAVTLPELTYLVGVDAARYAMSRFPSGTAINVESLRRHTNDNPVFPVQYVYARLTALAGNAVDLGINVCLSDKKLALLNGRIEQVLLCALADFPDVVSEAIESDESAQVAKYLERLTDSWHEFYCSCRILPQADEQITSVFTARLLLCAAVRQVIANGLGLLGVSAPERI